MRYIQKKLIPILLYFILLVCSKENFGQPNFVLDTIYLPNQSISHVSSSYNGELWFIRDSSVQQLYKISTEGKLFNQSATFSSQISSGITDIVCVDTNEIIIGTSNDYAYHYRNGQFTHINQNRGLNIDENHINSLYLKRTVEKRLGEITYEKVNFGIATNKKMYRSLSIDGTYSPFGSGNEAYNNNTFLSKENEYIIKEPYANGTNVTYYSYAAIYDLGSFDYNEYGNVLCAAVSLYSTGRVARKYVGTKKGYASMSGSSKYRHLINQTVHSMLKLGEFEILIGSDKGLYYTTNHQEPIRIELGIGDFVAYELKNCLGAIYIASNIGLLKIIDSDCGQFYAEFDQNTQIIELEKEEQLKLSPLPLYGADKWKWSFGDSETSSLMHPIHTFTKEGNFKIELIASNNFCSDTTSSIVAVYQKSNFDSINFVAQNTFPFDGQNTRNKAINIIDANGDRKIDIHIPSVGLFEVSHSNSPEFNIKEFNPILTNAAWGDLDNDGLNDIISGNVVYKNNGNYQFEKIILDSELHFPSYSKICLLDYNLDGLLDILLGYGGLEIFINKGDFIFESLDEQFFNENLITGIKWFDIDNDNDNDLLITCNNNYYGSSNASSTNAIYINENGNYSSKEFGLITDLRSKVCNIADLNNDKKLDVFIDDYLFIQEDSTLTVHEMSWLTEDSKFFNYYTTGSSFSDFDNNGYLDCAKVSYDKNRILLNYGDYIFKPDLNNPIESLVLDSDNAIVSADVTRNGKTDILISTGDNYNTHAFSASYFFENKSPNANNWVKINCFGTKSNFNAIGAKIYTKAHIEGNDVWQYRIIESSSGPDTQNGFELHFGMGDASIVDSLLVIWPSGEETTLTNLNVNASYNIIEPFIRYHGDTITCENVDLFFQMPYCEKVNYQWILNDSLIDVDTCYFKIRYPGQYKCVINSPYSVDTTPSIDVIIKEVSDSKIQFLSPDSAFCPGDSIKIESLAYENSKYFWYINGVLDTLVDKPYLYVNDTLSIKQILLNEQNCHDTSNTLTTYYYPKPSIWQKNQLEFCEGDILEVSADSTFKTYKWSNGDTIYKSFFEDDDTLFLTVSNEFDCYTTDTIMKKVWPLPYVNLGPDTTINQSEIYRAIKFCNSYYEYLWSDGSTDCSRYFMGLDTGFHTIVLSVKNQHMCKNSDTLILNVISDTDNVFPNDIKNDILVYPNPTNGKIYVSPRNSLINNEISIELFNNRGQIIKKSKYFIVKDNILEINIDENYSGIIFMKITGNSFCEKKKLIIN